ncbi:MAG TPA: Uma2 family endonuclease [Burkholderiales bacterium]|nr:Uma2 family endonuclease [Burkholderiales bacterium]
MQELIEAPLNADQLAARYRALCEDPCYANVPGKIELDVWGRLLMSPASNYHSALQKALSAKFAALGGQAFVEVSVLTNTGVLVADVAWASAEFMRSRGFETPYTRAPELCVEVVSPSNSRKELREKVAAYLAAGAEEVWIVFPESKRCEFHGTGGLLERSRYAVDLSDIFG